jgi:hypothetical protein
MHTNIFGKVAFNPYFFTSEAELMRVQFLDIILRVLRLWFPYTVFALQTSFKSLFLKGGGRVKLVTVTVNSKEGNS